MKPLKYAAGVLLLVGILCVGVSVSLWEQQGVWLGLFGVLTCFSALSMLSSSRAPLADFVFAQIAQLEELSKADASRSFLASVREIRAVSSEGGRFVLICASADADEIYTSPEFSKIPSDLVVGTPVRIIVNSKNHNQYYIDPEV